MLESSFIITQLPSSLWNSPIYEAYEYYVDDGLDTLQSDIEGMFQLRDVAQLTQYMLSLKMQLARHERKKYELDRQIGFKRLLDACAYTENPLDSIFWLLKLTHNIDVLKTPFIVTGLQLKTNVQHLGAILGPLSTKTTAWPRTYIG